MAKEVAQHYGPFGVADDGEKLILTFFGCTLSLHLDSRCCVFKTNMHQEGTRFHMTLSAYLIVSLSDRDEPQK
eukprot:5301426-Amphidinium_carterae.1